VAYEENLDIDNTNLKNEITDKQNAAFVTESYNDLGWKRPLK